MRFLYAHLWGLTHQDGSKANETVEKSHELGHLSHVYRLGYGEAHPYSGDSCKGKQQEVVSESCLCTGNNNSGNHAH